MTPRNISFTDLAKIPGSIGIMERNNKEEINQLLSQLGFDVRLGYEINICHHRALTTNQAVYGPRIEGYESTSEEWLNSGNASLEAKMEACTDPTLRDALLEMCRTGSSDKTFQNKNVAKNALKNQRSLSDLDPDLKNV